MVQPNGKIAFFDVDKTLCSAYSGYYTVRELIRRKIIKKRRIAQAVLYKSVGHLFKQMNVRRMYEIALADMAGTPLSDVMKIGYEVFERFVQPTFFPEALAEIEKRKTQGYFVALISSGPYMCIQHIEKYVGADTSFSSGPIIKNGILQKEVQEPVCYKEGKVLLAKSLAEQRGTDLKDCCFYSDSYSDLPLLELVGEPFAVNPDRNLQRAANARGWPILRFGERLRS